MKDPRVLCTKQLYWWFPSSPVLLYARCVRPSSLVEVGRPAREEQRALGRTLLSSSSQMTWLAEWSQGQNLATGRQAIPGPGVGRSADSSCTPKVFGHHQGNKVKWHNSNHFLARELYTLKGIQSLIILPVEQTSGNQTSECPSRLWPLPSPVRPLPIPLHKKVSPLLIILHTNSCWVFRGSSIAKEPPRQK